MPEDNEARPNFQDCVWKPDEMCYQTGCGNGFTCMEDGITENGFKFCPYCGGRIVEESSE